jgi:hypothetical protein
MARGYRAAVTHRKAAHSIAKPTFCGLICGLNSPTLAGITFVIGAFSRASTRRSAPRRVQRKRANARRTALLLCFADGVGHASPR